MAMASTAPAWAQDAVAPRLSDPAVLQWTGPYFGGHFGYGTGHLGGTTSPQLDQGVVLPPSILGLMGGYQAGYAYQFRNTIVLGAEIDVTGPGPLDAPANAAAPYTTSVEYIGTARARLGFAVGRLLPYVTGGFALGRTKTTAADAAANVLANKPVTHTGWTAGAGLEFPLAGRWSGKFEYDFVSLNTKFAGVAVEPDAHLFKLGLNYRFDALASSGDARAPGWTPETDYKNWNVHAQSTFIAQGYPQFRAPYQGTNSLPSGGAIRETWTATAFIGLRIAKGLEVYFNPELDQGGGIGKTLGLGGFANGEAQKGGTEFPRFRPQRYFVRQTIGLGGEQEKVEDGPNQLAGSQDVNRLTLTAGRFAVNDFFDNNAYAHDPRADFLNWAMWASAAVDFPADLPGFTRGFVAELNRKDWTLRGGLFQVPAAPNSDVLAFKSVGSMAELEQRYMLGGQAGKLRLGAFANRANTGSFSGALQTIAANPGLDPNTAIANTREQRNKFGVYGNVEQAITADIGVFARLSWNDGRNEILAFTDVDASASGGVAIKGTSWGRPSDTIGFGGAINGLSQSNRDFLAAGGLGLIIGDGALRYRPEKILETYYAFNLGKGKTLTTDYQFIANPGYNADRGPVSIFATRLHVEF